MPSGEPFSPTLSPSPTPELFFPTLSACPTLELCGPFDMHYYLTEGLEGVEHQKYRGATFTQAVDRAREVAVNSTGGQYIVFSSVQQKNLAYINRTRDAHYKGLRFLYLDDEETLIVRGMFDALPSLITAQFIQILNMKMAMMGVDDVLINVGGASFKGRNSSKEAYCGLKPVPPRSYKIDWPTLVFECGALKSKRRLIADACWWLENSHEEIKIVIVIKASQEDGKVKIEQWEMDTGPHTQATQDHPDGSRIILKRTQKVTIFVLPGSRAVATAPFGLNFSKIFLCNPNRTRGEEDIVLSKVDLEDIAIHVWDGWQ